MTMAPTLLQRQAVRRTNQSPTALRPGFTLVEVMVSLVVLAVGLLALAQLYVLATRTSTNGYRRTIAQVQALDMGERVWLDLTSPLLHHAEWQAENANSLPNWSGPVDLAPDANGNMTLVTITVQWGGLSGGGGSGHEYHIRVPTVTQLP